MSFRFPAPTVSPNPYAVFVQSFLAAKDRMHQQYQEKERLKIAKEDEKARREEEKFRKEQDKADRDERKAKFDYEMADSDRRFKLQEANAAMGIAEGLKNFRKPSGAPFSLTVPGVAGNPSTDVQPTFFEDVNEEWDRRDDKNFGQQKEIAGMPPAPVQFPQGFNPPGFAKGTTSADPRALAAAVSIANTDTRAAGHDGGSPMDRVTLRDGMGNVTGMWDKKTNTIVPIGQSGMRTAAIPNAEFASLNTGRGAIDALIPVEETLNRFLNTSILNPVDKALSGSALNSSVQAMSRTIGRALGEKGVFTDSDKEDFAKFINPGVVFSMLAPDEAKRRLDGAKAVIRRAVGRNAQTFMQRYGTIPDDAREFLMFAPGGVGNDPSKINDPGGLFQR